MSLKHFLHCFCTPGVLRSVENGPLLKHSEKKVPYVSLLSAVQLHEGRGGH
uniref:Uncharacterized protein n=1 Tax=Anguilla anguilla TaxID=7936 RepID=A0A0E9P8I0_ANGAN